MWDIAAAIARERVLFSNLFLLLVILGMLVGWFMGTVYTAEARLLILSGHETDAAMVNEPKAQRTHNAAMASLVLTEAEMLRNRLLAQDTVEHIGLSALYPRLWKKYQDVRLPYASWWLLKIRCHIHGGELDAEYEKLLVKRRARWFDRAVSRFVKSLEIGSAADSNIIVLRFRHKDPVMAAGALDMLLKLYLERRRQLYAPLRYPALMAQRDTLAEQLNAAEQALADFRQTHSIGSFEEQKSLLLRQMEELNANLMRVEANLGATEARRLVLGEQIQSALNATPDDRRKAGISPDSEAAMRKTLETLDASHRELLSKYPASNPEVRDIEGKIQALSHYLKSTRNSRSDPNEAALDSSLNRLTSEKNRLIADAAFLRQRQATLAARQEGVRTRLQEYDRMETDFNRLETRRDVLSDNLRIYSEKLDEALIREELERQKLDYVRVIQQPEIPARGLDWVKLTSMAVLLGGFVALVVTLVRDRYREGLISANPLDNSLSTASHR